MKIAIISTARNGAVDQVMKDIVAQLPDIEVDFFYPFDIEDDEFEEYDLVHWAWAGAKQWKELAVPYTGTIWGIQLDNWEHWKNRLNESSFRKIVCDDDSTIMLLHQQDYTNITQIPLTRNFSDYNLLPYPEEEFTVGCFGNDYVSKRFAVTIKAVNLAKVKCWAMVFPPERQVTYLCDPIKDVYSKCHVLVHAAKKDTNSLPAMEMLACGRPIISVINCGIRRVLQEGINGEFFDGTIEDLAKKIKMIEGDYGRYWKGAQDTYKSLPDIKVVAESYRRVWEDAISRG